MMEEPPPPTPASLLLVGTEGEDATIQAAAAPALPTSTSIIEASPPDAGAGAVSNPSTTTVNSSSSSSSSSTTDAAPLPALCDNDTKLGEEKEKETEEEGSGAATATASSPVPPVLLKGTLIGLFVAIDPAQQGQKLNMKRTLESLGIHQRDLAAGEEVQLSLDQAFYLHANLKALEIYMPAGSAAEEEETQAPLSTLECWKAFRASSTTFVRSVGSYRYFREEGFVVHCGLNLGLDFMLYRGTPQRYHAEFGVLLRYPSCTNEGDDNDDDKVLNWRELHLLYRLIGEVRKTLILGHVRLGEVEANEEELGGGEQAETSEEDRQVAREIARWYTGLSMYEVAVTPWRANTPLARMSKGRGDAAAQVKRGPGQGSRKGGRGGGGGGAGKERGEQGEQPASKRHQQQPASKRHQQQG